MHLGQVERLGKKKLYLVYNFQCDHCGSTFEGDKKKLKAKFHFCPKPAPCSNDSMRKGGCRYLQNGGFQEEKSRELSENETISRNKLCENCGEEFVDRSKKGGKTKCSKRCVQQFGVKTRQEKGSYVRTEAQNQKLSETLREKYEAGWDPNTPEHRQKLSAGMKGRWASGEMAEKTRETCLEKYGVDHWMLSDKAREHFKKSWGNAGYRDDLGQSFRSNWEANYARILNHQGKTWVFEPERFVFPCGETYLPDFLVDGEVYVEIKGWMDERSIKRIALFREHYPGHAFTVVGGVEYLQLKNQYKHLLRSWE